MTKILIIAALISLAAIVVLAPSCTNSPTESFGEGPGPKSWQWLHPTPHGNSWNAVWGEDATAMYGVDNTGGIYVINSVTGEIRPEYLANDRELYDIHGRGSDNIYAVGGEKMLHFDGVSWRAVDVPEITPTGYLSRVWVAPDGVVYVVGPNGMILRRVGAEWEYMLRWGEDLEHLWGTAADNVYAASWKSLIHFDGARWHRITLELPAGADEIGVLDIGGTGPDDVFVIAMSGVYHFDGDDWVRLDGMGFSRLVQLTNGELLAFNYNLRDAQRYDGEWHDADIPHLGRAISEFWGRSATEIIAFGYDAGHVYQLNGSTWRDLSNRDTEADLRDLVGFAPNDIYAVDGRAVLHYDGARWTEVVDTPEWTRAIWGRTPDNLYVGGDRGYSHYDGASWHHYEIDSLHISDICGFGSGDVFMAGDDGYVLRLDDATSEVMMVPDRPRLYGMWGTSRDNVYAVGWALDLGPNYGVIVHYDGTSWVRIEEADARNSPIIAIHGFSADDIFAAPRSGWLFHYDAVSWGRIGLQVPGGHVRGLWGTSGDDLFITTFGNDLRGRIYHYDGWNFNRMNSHARHRPYAMWGDAGGNVFGVGPDGMLLRYGR
jgi:hypothetical protein